MSLMRHALAHICLDFLFTLFTITKDGSKIKKINCVFFCSASETGGEEAAGGEQQGERAQKKEGEVRREGTVQQQEPRTSADMSVCSPVVGRT